MDYVTPKEMVSDAIELARKKADLPVPDLLIRGVLAGAFLGCATSLALMALSQGLPPLVAAHYFSRRICHAGAVGPGIGNG